MTPTLALFSLLLVNGEWLPREVMPYDECVSDAITLNSIATETRAHGGFLTLDGYELEVVGVRCEPYNEPGKPTS